MFTKAMSVKIKLQSESRLRRQRRVRRHLKGSSHRPRLSVFRSNRYISAQIIDDAKSVTLASVSGLEATAAETKTKKTMSPAERAAWVGGRIAEKAKAKDIREVQFDRSGYRYHGLVAALAAAARQGGLKF